jgi:hypothetical protein
MSRLAQIQEILRYHAEMRKKKMQNQLYRIDEDIKDWKDAHMGNGIGALSLSTAYNHYYDWAKKNGKEPKHMPEFSRVIGRLGRTGSRRKDGVVYRSTNIKEQVEITERVRQLMRAINPMLPRRVKQKIAKHTDFWDMTATNRIIKRRDTDNIAHQFETNAVNARRRQNTAAANGNTEKAAAEEKVVIKSRQRRDVIDGITAKMYTHAIKAIEAHRAWKGLGDGGTEPDSRKPGKYFTGKK